MIERTSQEYKPAYGGITGGPAQDDHKDRMRTKETDVSDRKRDFGQCPAR